MGSFLPHSTSSTRTTTMTEREINIHESEVIGHILTDLDQYYA